MDCVIGVDFDNTLVSYDDVMHRVALQRGLIHLDIRRSKKDVRDRIRQLPDGEIEWQKLQAIVYGPRMGEAKLIEGVQLFFEFCKHYKVRVYIISHKTEFANLDKTGTNLRATSLGWMRRNGFFEADGLGLSPEDVYFESTRREKVERVRHLKCTHLIDDLEETFLEDSFPTNVEKILYAPHAHNSAPPGVKVFTTWKEICCYFFDARS